MKILFTHRYFWPDTSPYATMLRTIAGHLAAKGHDVTVFTTQPSYHSSSHDTLPSHEEIDGFKVVRIPIFKERKGNLPLRALNVLIYAFGLRRHILKNKNYDVVTVATFPPIVAAKVAASAAHKIGAKLIYHFQDLHPEVSLFSGGLKRGRLFNFLQNLDSKTCRKADGLVLLSQDMKNTLLERPGNDHLRPTIINNFMLDSFHSEDVINELVYPRGKFVILFAGNIGKFQNLDVLIAAAHKLKNIPDIQFWFMGEGVAKARLEQLAGILKEKTVFFLPQQHHSTAQWFMGKANLNVISLSPNIYRVAYPSKTMAILSAGSSILSLIEQESELSQMTAAEGVGYVATTTDPDDLVEVIRMAYTNRSNEVIMRRNAKRLYDERFDKKLALDQWCELFRRL